MGTVIFGIMVMVFDVFIELFCLFVWLPDVLSHGGGIMALLQVLGCMLIFFVGIYMCKRNIRDSYILKVKKRRLQPRQKSSSWPAAVVGFLIYSPRNDYYEAELTTKGQIKVRVLFIFTWLAAGIGLTCYMLAHYGKAAFVWPQLLAPLLNIVWMALIIWDLSEIRKLAKQEKKNGCSLHK